MRNFVLCSVLHHRREARTAPRLSIFLLVILPTSGGTGDLTVDLVAVAAWLSHPELNDMAEIGHPIAVLVN
jgi:hypothetical protein